MRKIVLLIFALSTAAVLAPFHGSADETVLAVPSVARPEFRTARAVAISKKVTSLKASVRPTGERRSQQVRQIGGADSAGSRSAGYGHDADAAPAGQTPLPMPTPTLSFDGLSNFNNLAAYGVFILPPDPNGDVGRGEYVQAVNSLLRVYSKNGQPRSDPFRFSDLFAPLGTPCASRNDGNPVVLYDTLADRWLISEYCTAFPPFRQMIAVSRTGDPAGSYYLYEFVMPNMRLNDAPKLGVWRDGYYMSSDEFIGSDYTGSGVFAFDRAKMLTGDPTAGYIYFSIPSRSTQRFGNLLPADLDGLTPPPAGSPNIFAGYSATEYGDKEDAVRLFDFHADFSDPANSTFSERPESPIAVAAFDPTSPDGRQDILQPSPGLPLDSNSDKLMYRVAYRNYGDHESLLINQTVRLTPISSQYRAGVRIYELQRTTGAFSIHDQATLGDDSSSRWIGGAAQDNAGNVAIGYNYGSDAKVASLLYSGRLAGDPPGSYRNESGIIAGTGVQKAFGYRWGDYSGMSVDPVDDCTFWMTGEYFSAASETFSEFTWLTRIGRFKFDECTPAERGYLVVGVIDDYTGQPVDGASVDILQDGDTAYFRQTGTDGRTGRIMLPVGLQHVRVSAHGFDPLDVETYVPISDQSSELTIRLRPIPVIENPGAEIIAESCRMDHAAEPGETITMNLALSNTGRRMTRGLRVTLTGSDGVIASDVPVIFGMFLPGTSVTRPFTFSISPNVKCGQLLTLTFSLRDGRADLGRFDVPLRVGAQHLALYENFDSVSAPELPARWSTEASGHEPVWASSDSRSVSYPNAAFSPSANQVGVNALISPPFYVASDTATLEFRNWYELETSFLRNRLYDGSVLEIKIGDGDWQDIAAAGGIFETGGYDGTLDSCCQNPLAGRPAWSGRSGPDQASQFIPSVVKFPASAAGRTVQLRWRIATDLGTNREGQYIDDVMVRDGYDCACTGGAGLR